VDREELLRAPEPLGVPFDEHALIVVEAMREISPALGLGGEPASSDAARG
jgi:hypothetical protein